MGQEPAGPPAIDPADDFSPMLFLFALVALCVMLFLIGVGVVVAAVAALCLGVLILLGIISSSACMGVIRHRFSAGLRALHYQIFAVLMIPAGIGSVWLARALFDLPYRLRDVLWMGSLAGLCGGLLLAFVFDRIAVTIYRRMLDQKAPAVIDVS